MDNKNVFVAIALSMSVLLFWGAFFETPRKPTEQVNKKVEQETSKSSISPTISHPQKIKQISREKKDIARLIGPIDWSKKEVEDLFLELIKK